MKKIMTSVKSFVIRNKKHFIMGAITGTVIVLHQSVTRGSNERLADHNLLDEYPTELGS